MRRKNKDRLIGIVVIVLLVAGVFGGVQAVKAHWADQQKGQKKALQAKINGLTYRVIQKIAEGRRVDFKEVFPDLPIYDVDQKINIGAQWGPNREIIISGNTHGTGLMSSLVGMTQINIEVTIIPHGYDDCQVGQVIKRITYYPSGLWNEWGVYSQKEEQVLEDRWWKL